MDLSPRSPVATPQPPALPKSPGVTLTAADGTKLNFPSHVLLAASPAAELDEEQVFFFDSGWGGVDMADKLARKGKKNIVHVKNNFAGFPKEFLEEQLRGMPGGSHLEMTTEVDGVKLIAIGTKYNSKKTQFHLVTEGAGSTLPGRPYVSKFHDELGNVLTREVARPAAVSRYFSKFNKVDVHDHRRQHELGLERKWVGKDEKAGKFRLWTTVKGVTAIDTMLSVQSHSSLGSPIRSKTTREFIELLAEEMIDNDIDGAESRPVLPKRARTTTSALEMPAGENSTHELATIGYMSDVRPLQQGEKDAPIQYRCSVCGKKATTYCTAPECDKATVCSTFKRGCFSAHCAGPKAAGGVCPAKAKAKATEAAKKRRAKVPNKRAGLLASPPPFGVHV